jgi:hypothetical protein
LQTYLEPRILACIDAQNDTGVTLVTYSKQLFNCHLWDWRKYQKFSDRLEGLFKRLRANLHSFQYSVLPESRPMAKRTTITVETDSLLILWGRSSRRGWCPLCEAEAEMVALEDTGVITNLERPALEAWLNSEDLHRSQAADGSVVTCLNSLLDRVKKTKTS